MQAASKVPSTDKGLVLRIRASRLKLGLGIVAPMFVLLVVGLIVIDEFFLAGWRRSASLIAGATLLFLFLGAMAFGLTVLRRNQIGRERAERRLEDAIESISEGFALYDKNDRLAICNHTYKDLYAQSAPAMVLGTSFEDIIRYGAERGQYAEAVGRIEEFVNERVRQHRSQSEVIEQQLGDGRWVRIAERKTKEGGIVGIRTDITALKNAEEALRIAAIAFDSQEGMLVTNANAAIIRVNRAFTVLTGYREDEIVGKTPAVLSSGRHGPEFYLRMWQLLKETGYWQGEVWNKRRDGRIFAEWLTVSAVRTPGGAITHYVGTFTDITKSKGAEAEIHRLAYYDSLTHLPNRRLLLDRLQQTILGSHRSRQCAAVLFVNLDHFKKLNDTRGRDVGDQLLAEAARRMKQCVLEEGTVARLGGDEFVILLEGLSENRRNAALQVEHFTDKLRKSLQDAYDLGGKEFHCSASIGIALIDDQATSAEEVLRHANLALNQAKDAGGNCFRFFAPTMQEAMNRRAELEADLRGGIDRRQFCIHYQPQVDAVHRIVGAEALVRWQHPSRGLVPPDDFIPLAEETGLILPIGEWVLETVCLQLKAWSLNPAMSELQVAVNVSATQFGQHDFALSLEGILARTGANPRQLKIELTESMVLEDVNDTFRKIASLKEIGVSLSLDDFGTGYSSLSYLTQLPIDQLKIDKSFVMKLPDSQHDAVIAQTIVAMAHGLELAVIAEGVESERQKEFLQSHGCHLFQGYLFSRPLPLVEFEEYVQRNISL